MYQHCLQDSEEVEVVMRVTSSNWVGLGWRPQGISKTCQNFPDLNKGSVSPDAEPEGEGMDIFFT